MRDIYGKSYLYTSAVRCPKNLALGLASVASLALLSRKERRKVSIAPARARGKRGVVLPFLWLSFPVRTLRGRGIGLGRGIGRDAAARGEICELEGGRMSGVDL